MMWVCFGFTQYNFKSNTFKSYFQFGSGPSCPVNLFTYPGVIVYNREFAYQTNRSADDAVALDLHYVMKHLEQSSTYARILFVDFSSAFNTIIPVKLFDKLVSLNVHPAICHWTLIYLLHRPQSVKVNNSLSKPVILNTGAPQGCVLSPFLFTLFTNDCVSGNQSVRVVKLSDGTSVIGCVIQCQQY